MLRNSFHGLFKYGAYFSSKRKYGLTILAIVLATLLGAITSSVVSSGVLVWFSLAVLVSTIYSGKKAGLLSIVLSLLSAKYFLLPPLYSLSLSQDSTVQLLLLAVVTISTYVAICISKQEEDSVYQLFNSNLIGVMFWNADGRITNANDAFLRMIGYGKKDLWEGKLNWRQLTPPEQIYLSDRSITEMSHLGADTLVKEYVCKDGKRISIMLGGVMLDKNKQRGVSLVLDTTELNQTKLALQETEIIYQTLSQALPYWIWILRPDGTIEHANERLYEYTHLTIAEINEKGWGILTHPDDLPELKQKWEKNKNKKVSNQIEVRYRSSNGSYRWFLNRYFPIKDEYGQIKRWIGTSADIHERKQHEQELQQQTNELQAQQQWLEEVVNLLPTALLFIEPVTGRVLFSNKAADELAGGEFPKAQSSEDYESLYYCTNKQGERLSIELMPGMRVAKGEILSGFEMDWHVADRVRSIIVFGYTLPAMYNRPEVGVMLFQDITERKQLEQNLYRSEQQFKTLAENAPDVIARLDRQFRHIYISPAITQATGKEASEFIGKTSAELGYPESVYVPWQEKLQQIFETQEPCFWESNAETKEGLRYYQARMVPELGLDGTVESVLSISRDVTDFKQVEAALRDALQKLTFHVENSPLSVIEWDRNLQITRWSAEAERTFGWKAEEVLGRHFTDLQFVFGEDLSIVESVSQKIITGTSPQIISRNRNYTKDGSILHCVWYNSTLTDDFGNVESVLSLVLNVTESKIAEENLKYSQERLELAQQIGKIGAFEWNFQNNTLMWTKEMEALYGLVPGAFSGKYEDWLKLLHPSDRKLVHEEIISNQSQGQGFDIEFRIICPDQNIRWIAAKAQVFSDHNGKPWRLIGVNMDITARKQAEEARRQSEQIFRIAQDLSLDAFTVLKSVRNEGGSIIDFIWDYANPKAAEMIGKKVDDLVSNRLLTVLPGNKEQSDLFERYVNVVQTGEPHDIEVFYNWDGMTGWFRNMAVKLDDGVAVSFTDITRRKQDETERSNLLEKEKLARAEAEAANRIKDEFLAVLSHELRTPINLVLGWSKLLRSRKFDEATTERALDTIERNAKLQTQLIEDLLDVSRILRGKLSLNVVPVDLATVIESSIETVNLAAEAKNIQIQREIDNNIRVLGDANRLQQVVWNLLSNAVKFTPLGGSVSIKLVLRASEAIQMPYADDDDRLYGKYAEIEVTDTGKGIEPEFLPYVFDSFRQADSTSTRSFGGLGLGLAIVKHLVELHGGTVTAASAGVDKGATFTVYLPVLVNNASEENPDGYTEEVPNLVGTRILVVDDEADTRELIAFTLEKYGARVESVGSAQEALQVLNNSQQDLLLSDIGMPDMDGYMLVKQVRHSLPEQNAKIPAIALTAYASELDAQQAIAAGFHCHLSKPVEPIALANIVSKFISHKRNSLNN